MVRPLLAFAALGLAGIVVWKLLWTVLIPVAALLLGLFVTLLKIGAVIVVAYLAYRLFKAATQNRDPAP